ncbi:MAG: DUF1501 domain-containing protein [Phycisphaerales bacterium]|nr:DUF1501 domain-containing protein [Phycisphaerales bacterium]
MSRRSFLVRTGAGIGALGLIDPGLRAVAQTFAQTNAGTGNLLVLCQLNGGMDALSFLAPHTNAAYQAKRPLLALGAADVTPLPGRPEYGITNHCDFFSELYGLGQCAIVQQVAYPNGNGSHFESQEIYEYGVRNLSSATGTSARWYERLRKTYFDEPFGVMDTAKTGDPRSFGYPDTTYRHAAQHAFGRYARMKAGATRTEKAMLDTYARIDEISQQLRDSTQAFTSTGAARGEFWRAAAIASANLGTQILKVSYGGFDTHGSQNEANATLFPRLNNEFRQFKDDLVALGLWDRTTVVFYTEFGRRNEENGSPGTDHGYAGHMILCGPRVNGGLHGQNVTTADINQPNLPYYVDFRGVFSQCIQTWLGFNPTPIFSIDNETFDSNVGSALFR